MLRRQSIFDPVSDPQASSVFQTVEMTVVRVDEMHRRVLSATR
jgi:hypothetical protein